MTESSFIPETGGADISAYENTDLSALNTLSNDLPPTEKKLENILIRVVFFARIAGWIGIILCVLSGLYSWSRSQTQDSWLMTLPMNKSGTTICTWINRGFDEKIRKDTAFRDFLISQGKQSYLDIVDQGRCIAPDTLVGWLELQKLFMSQELARAYETIIPKKFIGTTITTSPELDVIARNSPEHRMHHDDILKHLSETADKLGDSSSRITCSEVRFFELSADAQCEVVSRSPVQPRARAIAFLKELSTKEKVLITYPNTLDMTIDEKTKLLKTSFVVKMTYIPARYEAEKIKKLTYDKR